MRTIQHRTTDLRRLPCTTTHCEYIADRVCFYAQFLTSVHRKAHPSPPERSRLFIENEMAIWRAGARGAGANMMYRIMMR